MKIISGEHKGRLIKLPRNFVLRPTQNKVREAVFEILKDKLPGASVLELFSGSGALGIEALSRGVESVVFVEKQIDCVKAIRDNLNNLGLQNACCMQADAFSALKRFAKDGVKFGIIIADPPYNMGYPTKILIKLDTYDILKHPFLVLLQHSKEDAPSKEKNSLVLLKQYRYGGTFLSVFTKKTLNPKFCFACQRQAGKIWVNEANQ